jgi:hypothetical protein
LKLKHADASHPLALPCPRCEWPRRRRAAEQSDLAVDIFSKEVAQKQAAPFPRQDLPHYQKSFQTKFPGMGSG